MRLFCLFVALCALLGSGAAQAQLPGMDIHVHAGLEAETSRPAAGSTITLAITMRPDAGWHGYWINPGDAGDGLTLDWTLPPSAKIGAPRFPMPDTMMISGFMNYVYEAPHAILVDLTLPDNLAVGTAVPVRATANWLACTDRVCVPQQGQLRLDLVIGDGAITAASQKRFDAWRAALPVALDRVGHYAVDGKKLAIAIPYPASASVERPYFFPLTTGVIAYAAPQKVRRSGDWLVIETELAKSLETPPTGTISGVVRYGNGQGLSVTAEKGAVPAGGIHLDGGQAAENNGPHTPPLYFLLLGALAGGLILNIMPCVFPILGLKALALAKVGGDERAARIDALAYAAGVIFSCVALGGLMLALRAGGQEVGWAFQLQSPGFVLFLLLLMVAVTANLAGLFHLGSVAAGDRLTRMPGSAGSFWTGVLAALVATPCTGPFMAAALGAALLLPTAMALALFAALGLGIALPFLLIAFAPALRQRMPKPGPWLARFRTLMAIPMGLTACALLWLLWRLTGIGGLWVGAIASVILVILLSDALRFIKGFAKVAMAAVVLAAGLWFLPSAQDMAALQETTQNPLKAVPFSEARLADLRAKSVPVFVYFTADWCVTCKINEAAVLERPETAKLFAERKIAVLRGDFTRQDPAIARFLRSQKAAGVPLYLYYPAGRAGKQLPQILTADGLHAAVAN